MRLKAAAEQTRWGSAAPDRRGSDDEKEGNLSCANEAPRSFLRKLCDQALQRPRDSDLGCTSIGLGLRLRAAPRRALVVTAPNAAGGSLEATAGLLGGRPAGAPTTSRGIGYGRPPRLWGGPKTGAGCRTRCRKTSSSAARLVQGVPTYASEPQRRVRDFCVSLSDLSEL